ncbi:MAG TPA: Na+/H+ antiporter NhaA [Gaiellaceae bacterium]
MSAEPAVGRTAWARNLAAPLRAYLRAESASAAFLAVAVVTAVVWATIDLGDYERVWATTASVRIGGHSLDLTLRDWVNAGLMTFFFFVVGLEARRELDLGELRDRRRLVLPLAAAAAGMLLPIAVYLALTHGRPGAHGWGVAMSSDTALTLGVLALVGKKVPDRLRAFVVTVLVFDDLIALLVLVTAYSSHLHTPALLIAAAACAFAWLLVRLHVQVGIVYFAVGTVAWVAVHHGGIEPVVVGLLFGLLAPSDPRPRSELQRASELFRRFREQPTPQLARAAGTGVRLAVPPNERLQATWLPLTTYAVVPLFALVNAGVPLRSGTLGSAVHSRVALGIFVGYLVGKPVGICVATTVVARIAPRLRPPVGWLSVLVGSAAAASPFTLSLLIAAIALHGRDLASAKVAVLAAALAAAAASWLLARGGSMLSVDMKLRGLFGRAESTVDLAVPVDDERDHVRGPADATVTLVEYGDFECPYCGRAQEAIESVLGRTRDLRYVWRHLPLTDVHPHTQQAAEASEAAAKQGKFWEMHDLLLERQDELEPDDLVRYADELGLDVDRFVADVERHVGGGRIADDVDSAEQSGVAGTPTFFINGRRHWGAYDVDGLTRAVREARARARVAAS